MITRNSTALQNAMMVGAKLAPFDLNYLSDQKRYKLESSLIASAITSSVPGAKMMAI